MTQHGRELVWDGEREGGRKKEPRESGGVGGQTSSAVLDR